MAQTRPTMDITDLRILSDLAIYNCLSREAYTSLIYEDGATTREYTNVDIARQATRLAVGLQELGIQQGDRVIVTMLNCPEVVVAYQAIARAGGVIIPAMPLLKAPEIHHIAENSQAKAVITSPMLFPLLQEALQGITCVQHVICADFGLETLPEIAGSFQVHRYSDIVARGTDYAERYLEHLPGVSPTPDDPAVIIYTSGTTGKPKGVVLTHRNVVSNATTNRGAAPQEGTAVPEQPRQLAILPLAHSYGLVVLNVGYLSGAMCVMHPRFDTNAVLAAIERHRITGFAGVPAMFVALLYTPDVEKYDTSSLLYCVSGSAPLPLAVLEGFEKKFNCRILEGYGLSEASAVLTAHTQEMERKVGSVGKPIAGVELLIVDDNDQPLPTGQVGELIARGPNIMREYYNMPVETQNVLRGGWLHTGDMGYIDEDGYVYIVERKKDLIIRGGFNIYPRDVEEVLNRHPAVVESAVVGIPSERMGEEVKAFVVTREEIDAEVLKAYCREALANYKTPSEIAFVAYLPRNPVGKIDKKELRRQHVH
ncbi:MAG TPA: long-chain fatty acid--CoA ligase [Ktedonobacteraceae bacterium]|nr:long-chain fatty acid--CoA ligase [Ktedonobacteraceae bacterium]